MTPTQVYKAGLEAAAKCAEEYGSQSLADKYKAVFWASAKGVAAAIRALPTPPEPEAQAMTTEPIRATAERLIALRRTFDLRPVGDKVAYDNFVDACVIAGPRLAKALIAALDVVAEARKPAVTMSFEETCDRNKLMELIAAFDTATAEKGER